MSLRVPSAVKAADLARFATRASQLEKAKPVIAYYCDFWIVDQILAKNLHTVDEECQVYTTQLVEKLEQFKAENGEMDVIVDELAARAYVEQFGLETFQRADNAVRANKASRQTADTFQAAATFLELIQIWGEVDGENAAKIKYAKYHALRIAKALKAGQDPNASTSGPSPSNEDAFPALDPNDPEVQMLNGVSTKVEPARGSSVPRPSISVPKPSLEEVPDETYAQRSSRADSHHPMPMPSGSRPSRDEVSPVDATVSAEDFYNQTTNHDVSPLVSDPATGEQRSSSAGGNYFTHGAPSAPHFHQSQQPPLELPSAPSEFSSPPPEPSLPPTHPAFSPASVSPLPPSQTQPTYPADPTRSFQPPNIAPRPTSHATTAQHPHHAPYQQQQQPRSNPAHPTPRTAAPPPFRSIVSSTGPQQPGISTNPTSTSDTAIPIVDADIDEESIAASQKHARWAISALNFEDVPTAIKELRGALQSLGAT